LQQENYPLIINIWIIDLLAKVTMSLTSRETSKVRNTGVQFTVPRALHAIGRSMNEGRKEGIAGTQES
jgi:hypothetical protein